MTFLVLIFAEVLPKTYALHYADRMSMSIAPIIRIVVLIFSPVTEAVTWIVRQVLSLFGVNLSKVSQGSHLELLRGAIDMHDGKGKKTQEQRAMLRSILDLFEVSIEDIMIHRKNVTMIASAQSMTEITAQVLDSPYTRLPLWKDEQENIIGLIHAKLLLRALTAAGGDPEQVAVEDIIMKPWFIPETTSLYDQLQTFRERKAHFAVVVDEYGAFEHDMNVPGVRKTKEGHYMIEGTVPIRDLNRELGWNLSEDQDYATLAGLILYESQSVPDVGQSFTYSGFRFDVLKKNRNQIEMLKVVAWDVVKQAQDDSAE